MEILEATPDKRKKTSMRRESFFDGYFFLLIFCVSCVATVLSMPSPVGEVMSTFVFCVFCMLSIYDDMLLVLLCNEEYARDHQVCM